MQALIQKQIKVGGWLRFQLAFAKGSGVCAQQKICPPEIESGSSYDGKL